MILQGRRVSPGAFSGRAHILDARSWIHAASAVLPLRGAIDEIERIRAAQSRACEPRSAISLLNSRDLPTCYLAGAAETQL
jgi:hypothetical protein